MTKYVYTLDFICDNLLKKVNSAYLISIAV